jgi:hypothetical protein
MGVRITRSNKKKTAFIILKAKVITRVAKNKEQKSKSQK